MTGWTLYTLTQLESPATSGRVGTCESVEMWMLQTLAKLVSP